MRISLQSSLLIVSTAIMLMLSMLHLWQLWQKPGMAVIDTQLIILRAAEQIAKEYPQGKVPPEKLQRVVDALKNKIDIFADKQKIVLLAKGAVWGHKIPDYTDKVLEFLSEPQ